MSLIATAYIAAYLAFGIVVSLREFNTEGRLKNDTIAEIPMDACLVLAAAAYWHPPVASMLGALLAPMYVAGVALLGVLLLHSARNTAADNELSLGGRVFVGVFGVLVSIVVAFPLLYWGYQASFRGVGA